MGEVVAFAPRGASEKSSRMRQLGRHNEVRWTYHAVSGDSARTAADRLYHAGMEVYHGWARDFCYWAAKWDGKNG